MQIHELNNFTGTLGSGAYLAIDDGTDTGKISSQGLLAATEARIDNIIAGPAPSAEEIVDARLGADGVTYPSLGDAIRDQFTDVKSALDNYNSVDLAKKYKAVNNRTHNGITYAWANGIYTVSGTATSGSWCNIIFSNNGLPDEIKAGKVLEFIMNRSTENIEVELYWYYNGSLGSAIKLTESQEIGVPTTATGILMRLYVASGVSVSGTISTVLLNAASNAQLFEEIRNARRSFNGTIYGNVGIAIRTFEETALKRISCSAQQASDLYDNDIDKLPSQTYAVILPSWFNITDVAFPNNAHWLFKHVSSANITYRLIDITKHIEYIGYLHSGSITWVKTTNNYIEKKVANFGDSITWGRDGAGSASTQTVYTITAALNMLFNNIKADNFGVGGMGYFSTGGGLTALGKLQSVDITGYDVITLGFGTNDNSARLGTINDTDGTTMLGAMYQCYQYIRTQNAKCVIIFIAPPNASTFGAKSSGYWYGYARGPLQDYTLTQLVDGMRAFCEKYHLPFIDNLDSFDVENIASLMPDGVHPNDDGYKLYSNYIAKRISMYC